MKKFSIEELMWISVLIISFSILLLTAYFPLKDDYYFRFVGRNNNDSVLNTSELKLYTQNEKQTGEVVEIIEHSPSWFEKAAGAVYSSVSEKYNKIKRIGNP